MFRLLAAVVLVAVSLLSISVAQAADPARRVTGSDSRMDWWRDAKFGMFIHWGVYAVPAGEYDGQRIPGIGEWIMHRARIPVDEYRGYAKKFNPTKYDPQSWAQLADQAGMKYVVITAKHHDGFALYDSAVTDWDIVDASPYGKDLLRPLANAVRGEGLKFGLYYSQAQDWTHPGGAKMGMKEGEGWDNANRGGFDQYLRNIAVPQTVEILTRYQPDVLWWDTPTWMNKDRAEPLNKQLRLTPKIITNNRLGGGFQGDTETPEQYIPATGYKNRDWETCMTMNDTWGFKSYDHNWKSTGVLLHNLVDIVSKGGNYLLNIGPTAEGEIPQESIERLQEIGKWMGVNGDSIYATTASPCRRPAWGRITSKPGKLYLHVFDWPSDGQLVVPVQADVVDCRLLANSEQEFKTGESNAGLVVYLTGEPLDPYDTVVELSISNKAEEVFQRITPATDGSFELTAAEAVLEGEQQLEQIHGVPSVGYWTNSRDRLQWYVINAKPITYRVTAELAGAGASRFEVQSGDARLAANHQPTSSYQQFVKQDIGMLELASGQGTVSVSPSMKDWNPINLRRLTLTPLGD